MTFAELKEQLPAEAVKRITEDGSSPEEEIQLSLTSRYGLPFQTKQVQTPDGAIAEIVTGFNERYWAGLLKTERRIVYEPGTEAFWVYNSERGLFERHTNEAIRELVGMRLFKAAETEKRPEIKKLVSVNRLDVIVRAMVGIAEERDFFADRPSAIHLANGMVTESGGTLEFENGFNPRYRSRNQSPFRYKSQATCKRFLDELLNPMLPDPDDRTLFQKWAGLVLSGDNPAQRILLLDGTPGRGKGVIQRTITGLVGRENTTELRTSHLGERFELNRFVGKTLLQASDVPGDFLTMKWASILKSLVGGDYLDTETKGGNEAHEIVGNFNVLIVSNTRLRCRLDGDAGAWRRRLIILRTDSPPVKNRIPNFERILLRDEGDGILNWALEGYQMALNDLEQRGDLILSKSQTERVDGLLAESEALKIFVRDCIVRREGTSVTVDRILTAFAEFCADKGWQMASQATVTRELPDLMLSYHRAGKSNSIKTTDGTKRGFRGVEVQR